MAKATSFKVDAAKAAALPTKRPKAPKAPKVPKAPKSSASPGAWARHNERLDNIKAAHATKMKEYEQKSKAFEDGKKLKEKVKTRRTNFKAELGA